MNLSTSDVMSKNLITTRSTDDLASAYRKMKENTIRHLPVLDDDNKLVGIISDRDLKKAMISYESDSFSFDPDEIVSDYMSSQVISLPSDTELLNVAKKIIDLQISAVLISKENEIVGIITNEDLLRILVDLLEHPKLGALGSMQKWLYTTPIGEIATKLSDVGI